MEQISKNIFMWSKGPKTSQNHSYLVKRTKGNYFFGNFKGTFPVKKEIAEIEALGGISHVFFTHRDEATSNCEKVQEAFNCEFHFHEDDLEDIKQKTKCNLIPFVGKKLKLFNDLTAFHLPGHSKGFCYYQCKVGKETILFTGDMPYIYGDRLAWKTCRRNLYKDFYQALQDIRKIKFEAILSCVSKGGKGSFPFAVDNELKDRLFDLMEEWARSKG